MGETTRLATLRSYCARRMKNASFVIIEWMNFNRTTSNRKLCLINPQRKWINYTCSLCFLFFLIYVITFCALTWREFLLNYLFITGNWLIYFFQQQYICSMMLISKQNVDYKNRIFDADDHFTFVQCFT